jgi:gamma-glutamylcyclotransferase (GGCT)/AIG2-like uncharacterized protein YtfP
MLNENEPFEQLVAVYGTLRKGSYNNYVMGESMLLGTFTTGPQYAMYSLGGFPALTDGEHEVVIEVYKVTSKATMRRIDSLEGYNERDTHHGFYDRKTMETPWGPAFYYTQERDQISHLPLVASGDWMNR